MFTAIGFKREINYLKKQKMMSREWCVPATLKASDQTFGIAIKLNALSDFSTQTNKLIIDLYINKRKLRVLLTEVQKNCISNRLQHLSFNLISNEEFIKARVPLIIHSNEKVSFGYLWSLIKRNIEVECLSFEIPKSICFDLKLQQLNSKVIRAREVPLPNNIRLTEFEIKRNKVVAILFKTKKETAEASQKNNSAQKN